MSLFQLEMFYDFMSLITFQTMSSKEKGKFEDMAKADKLRYEKEMKNYVPPKGETKKKFKDPNAPKRPP